MPDTQALQHLPWRSFHAPRGRSWRSQSSGRPMRHRCDQHLWIAVQRHWRRLKQFASHKVVHLIDVFRLGEQRSEARNQRRHLREMQWER